MDAKKELYRKVQVGFQNGLTTQSGMQTGTSIRGHVRN